MRADDRISREAPSTNAAADVTLIVGGESSRETNAGSEDAGFGREVPVASHALSAVEGGIEVNAREDDEEPAKEGDGNRCVCCVETLEVDARDYDRCCCECDMCMGFTLLTGRDNKDPVIAPLMYGLETI
jgi:hypothetical protein